jgi:hypothetical protein
MPETTFSASEGSAPVDPVQIGFLSASTVGMVFQLFLLHFPTALLTNGVFGRFRIFNGTYKEET